MFNLEETEAGNLRLTPVISAIQEAAIGRIEVPVSPGK
jgi:hypothetical protein